jgi:cytidylate kinase
VRKILVEHQRKLGEKSPSGCVLDGRDIGTIVFPKCRSEIFPDRQNPKPERGDVTKKTLAKRSRRQLRTNFLGIKERDERDVSREDSPLSIAEDAIVIDTSELNLTEVYEQMSDIVRVKRNESCTNLISKTKRSGCCCFRVCLYLSAFC